MLHPQQLSYNGWCQRRVFFSSFHYIHKEASSVSTRILEPRQISAQCIQICCQQSETLSAYRIHLFSIFFFTHTHKRTMNDATTTVTINNSNYEELSNGSIAFGWLVFFLLFLAVLCSAVISFISIGLCFLFLSFCFL